MGRKHFRPERIIHMLREAAIVASPRYSVIKAGTSTTSVWSASGVARG